MTLLVERLQTHRKPFGRCGDAGDGDAAAGSSGSNRAVHGEWHRFNMACGSNNRYLLGIDSVRVLYNGLDVPRPTY